ncbi:DUF4080 domain-containing protein [Mycoplasmatota bacterium WC30]
MKVLVVGINSKYIHTNLAIRYLKANCSFPVDLIEFTIKDAQEQILEQIINEKPDILAFSVYIWNVEIIKALLTTIKEKELNINIILGGPEVSYEFNQYLEEGLANYIISNEGEIAFNLLVEALIYNKDIKNVPNVSYLDNDIVVRNKLEEIDDLEAIHNPYIFDNDDVKNKIQYVELSRGCPFNCAYCLASLEKKVRFFSLERVKSDINTLYKKGAKTFKFLDRTFNLKPDLALDLFHFIIDNDFSKAVFQFEINGDILTDKVINYLNQNCPENRIRFEIGIQSTNDKVNEAVDRKQDTDLLFKNIKKLKKGNIIMHLDLIAGLPYEDLASFKNTFNSAFKLYAKELQLGFLKILKGTKLYYQQSNYNYTFDKCAPYEFIENEYLSAEDRKTIHLAEDALEIFWNKGFLNPTIQEITSKLVSPFDFFYDLGKYYLSKGYKFHRYQLTDIFIALEEFINDDKITASIRYDYLKHHKIKPKIYWENQIKKNEIIRRFHSENLNYNIDKLYKYSVVTKYNEDYLITIYYPQKREMHILKAYLK